MSDLTQQLKEVEVLIQKKHQMGRHTQHRHTPQKYGAGTVGAVAGAPDANLQRAADAVLRNATTSEASIYETDFVVGSGEVDESLPYMGVRTNREGLSIIRANAKRAGWLKIGPSGHGNNYWHDPDTDVSLDIESRGGVAVLYYSKYRPGAG